MKYSFCSKISVVINGVLGESDMALFKDEISELIRRLQVLEVDLRFLEHNLNLLKKWT